MRLLFLAENLLISPVNVYSILQEWLKNQGQEQDAVADLFSRDYSDKERKRMEELEQSYQNDFEY